jgi:hypothetical protein
MSMAPLLAVPWARAAARRSGGVSRCSPRSGSDLRGVAEIYLRTLFLSHFFDFRIIHLPLFQSLVAFERTLQWRLSGDAELRQQTPH